MTIGLDGEDLTMSEERADNTEMICPMDIEYRGYDISASQLRGALNLFVRVDRAEGYDGDMEGSFFVSAGM